jgi:hypothetical protein
MNHLTVEAQGYALAALETTARDQDFVDWGDIRLLRAQALQITLLGLDAMNGFGPTDMRAQTEEGYILPPTPFDHDGVVRFEDVPPGDHKLMVYYPDGSWARLQLRLEPGQDWSFDLKAVGDRKLFVRAADHGGGPLPFPPAVLVSANEDSGVLVVRLKETDGGSASFEGIRAGKAKVWILDPDNNFVASKDVEFGDSSTKEIEVRVGEGPFRVHVVDKDGEPVATAYVTIRSATGSDIHGVDQTGVDGWADLVGLPQGPLLMDVQHGVVGRSFGNLIDASAKELEFVLDAAGSLELELVDGDLPLAGVLTRIQTKAGLTLGDARQTDDGGRVRYEALGAGNYHLACHRADCWPTTVDQELGPGEQARVRVQMRRLADLEFTLLSADGLPVSDVAVELASEEFDAPIDAWLVEERIRAPGGLTTDARGSIRVEGLPRGPYSWSVTVLDGSATDTIELEAGRTNEVKGFLQP